MISPFHADLTKEIKDEFDQLMRNQLIPWSFLNTGRALSLTNSRGQRISYEGVRFEGSPREVFWSIYFLPCIEDIIASRLKKTVSLCKSESYFETSALDETAAALQVQAHSFLRRMAEIDRRLISNGYPERNPLRSVDGETARLDAFLAQHLSGSINQLRLARPGWLKTNKWWIELVGAAMLGGVVTFLFQLL